MFDLHPEDFPEPGNELPPMTIKERCYKCKGKGYVRGKIDYLAAVFTLGLTALMDKSDIYKCDACKGRGYI